MYMPYDVKPKTENAESDIMGLLYMFYNFFINMQQTTQNTMKMLQLKSKKSNERHGAASNGIIF